MAAVVRLVCLFFPEMRLGVIEVIKLLGFFSIEFILLEVNVAMDLFCYLNYFIITCFWRFLFCHLYGSGHASGMSGQ